MNIFYNTGDGSWISYFTHVKYLFTYSLFNKKKKRVYIQIKLYWTIFFFCSLWILFPFSISWFWHQHSCGLSISRKTHCQFSDNNKKKKESSQDLQKKKQVKTCILKDTLKINLDCIVRLSCMKWKYIFKNKQVQPPVSSLCKPFSPPSFKYSYNNKYIYMYTMYIIAGFLVFGKW